VNLFNNWISNGEIDKKVIEGFVIVLYKIGNRELPEN